MKSETENNVSPKLTIFKPPQYIYKLSKVQLKNNQKPEFEIYYNNQHSLRKYPRKLNITSQSQLFLYQWRKQSSCPIVKVVYLELVNRTIESSTCDNTSIDVNVYTENIEKSLADMINLTLCEVIYVLKQCILAYQEIFQKLASVSINKFYIGLNAQGKLKVWINSNFSLNTNINQSLLLQSSTNEVFTNEQSIMMKIMHMINLLAHSSCKHFLYGLQKSLSIKKFQFNNCLQYINDFVTKTKNIQIPTNLAYMLPKRSSFSFERSSVNFFGPTRIRKNQNEKKQNNLSNVQCTASIKNLGSISKFPERKNSQNKNLDLKQSASRQNTLRFKRYSQKSTNKLVSTLPVSKVNCTNSDAPEKDVSNSQQYRISLQVIMERNLRFSVKNNNQLVPRKSNSSLLKQRPSIYVVPTFLTNSSKRTQVKDNNLLHVKSQEKNVRFLSKSKESRSQSCNSRKNKMFQSQKIDSYQPKKLDQKYKRNSFNFTTNPPKISKIESKLHNDQKYKKTDSMKKIRTRSASANVKFGAYLQPILQSDSKKFQQSQIIQFVKSSQRVSLQKSKVDGQKASSNSISNEGTKKRSFLTKTNYDSNAQDTDKNFSTSRMDFSSMSIENRISNKNFDYDGPNARKSQTKRSLITFKYGFEKILQNPSCKQVEEQNQTKSYTGSSLKNTDNIQQALIRISKKNDESSLNGYSFGKNSNKIANRKELHDSTEYQLLEIKSKNEQVLMMNQWKKTINNLGELEDMELNQSIVDAHDQIIERDPYPDVRLEKLQKLGKDMCFSIVKKSDQVDLSKLNNSKLKSQFYQIF